MERIFFSGGDMDGKILDIESDLGDQYLLYDGSGGKASPRGRYKRSDEAIVIDDIRRTIWRIA
jgi:hypothetical protein